MILAELNEQALSNFIDEWKEEYGGKKVKFSGYADAYYGCISLRDGLIEVIAKTIAEVFIKGLLYYIESEKKIPGSMKTKRLRKKQFSAIMRAGAKYERSSV